MARVWRAQKRRDAGCQIISRYASVPGGCGLPLRRSRTCIQLTAASGAEIDAIRPGRFASLQELRWTIARNVDAAESARASVPRPFAATSAMCRRLTIVDVSTLWLSCLSSRWLPTRAMSTSLFFSDWRSLIRVITATCRSARTTEAALRFH